MAILIQQPVTVFDGVTQFSAKQAVIELHDDDHFTLYKIDEATGAITEVVMNVWLKDLAVSGSQAMLVFTSGGIKKRVDFSFGSRLAMGLGGVAGIAVSGALAKQSGVGVWVDALRQRGVPVKFMSFSKLLGISFAVAFGLVAVIVVIAVVGSLN